MRPARRLNRIGLELYSVRDAMRRDPERTLAAVRAMGYTDVELLWSLGNFARTTEQVRAALDKEGLRAPSAHISAAVLLVGWERGLAIAQRLGHEYLIVPSFTADTARFGLLVVATTPGGFAGVAAGELAAAGAAAALGSGCAACWAKTGVAISDAARVIAPSGLWPSGL